MITNQAKKIIEDSKKVYQFATKKLVVNIFYIIFAILAIMSLVMLVLSLTLHSSKVITPLLWTAVGVLLFCLVAFYIFEYIRRRAVHYYEVQFSFQRLYEANLMNNKLIDNHFNAINSENNEFLKMHMDLMAKNYGEFANLGNQFETYSYYYNQQNYLLSLAIVKDYGKKITKLNEDLQMIISTNWESKIDLYLSKKIDTTADSIFKYQLVDTVDNVNIYSNSSEYTKQKDLDLKQYIQLIEQVNNDNVNLDILIKKDKLLLMVTFKNNQLLLNFKEIKTFKDDLDAIAQKYDLNWEMINNVFKFIF